MKCTRPACPKTVHKVCALELSNLVKTVDDKSLTEGFCSLECIKRHFSDKAADENLERDARQKYIEASHAVDRVVIPPAAAQAPWSTRVSTDATEGSVSAQRGSKDSGRKRARTTSVGDSQGGRGVPPPTAARTETPSADDRRPELTVDLGTKNTVTDDLRQEGPADVRAAKKTRIDDRGTEQPTVVCITENTDTHDRSTKELGVEVSVKRTKTGDVRQEERGVGNQPRREDTDGALSVVPGAGQQVDDAGVKATTEDADEEEDAVLNAAEFLPYKFANCPLLRPLVAPQSNLRTVEGHKRLAYGQLPDFVDHLLGDTRSSKFANVLPCYRRLLKSAVAYTTNADPRRFDKRPPPELCSRPFLMERVDELLSCFAEDALGPAFVVIGGGGVEDRAYESWLRGDAEPALALVEGTEEGEGTEELVDADPPTLYTLVGNHSTHAQVLKGQQTTSVSQNLKMRRPAFLFFRRQMGDDHLRFLARQENQLSQERAGTVSSYLGHTDPKNVIPFIRRHWEELGNPPRQPGAQTKPKQEALRNPNTPQERWWAFYTRLPLVLEVPPTAEGTGEQSKEPSKGKKQDHKVRGQKKANDAVLSYLCSLCPHHSLVCGMLLGSLWDLAFELLEKLLTFQCADACRVHAAGEQSEKEENYRHGALPGRPQHRGYGRGRVPTVVESL